MDASEDIDSGWSIAWRLSQHRADERVERRRIERIGGYRVLRIEDGEAVHPALLVLEGGGIVAQLVQQHAQRPDIALLVDVAPLIEVDHFGRPVLDRCDPVELRLEPLDLVDCIELEGVREQSRAAEVAQLVGAACRLEDVLDLQVPMEDLGGEGMHVCEGVGDSEEDVEDLRLREAYLEVLVHDVYQATACCC